MTTPNYCRDCGTAIDYRASRCRTCWLREMRATSDALPSTFRMDHAPTLRDYPGQPALSGGYTSGEIATLSSLILAQGPWRPARWHRPLAEWNAEMPA